MLPIPMVQLGPIQRQKIPARGPSLRQVWHRLQRQGPLYQGEMQQCPRLAPRVRCPIPKVRQPPQARQLQRGQVVPIHPPRQHRLLRGPPDPTRRLPRRPTLQLPLARRAPSLAYPADPCCGQGLHLRE